MLNSIRSLWLNLTPALTSEEVEQLTELVRAFNAAQRVVEDVRTRDRVWLLDNT